MTVDVETRSDSGSEAYFYQDIQAASALSGAELATYLREIGDATPGNKAFFFGGKRPWQHTSHAYGFIPSSLAGASGPVAIQHAANITADQTLVNQQIKVTLDAVRIADYPGSGLHEVLVSFYANNQLLTGQTEGVHFSQVFRAQEGESVGAIGYTVFSDLTVGPNGIDFKCQTVNVRNENDEAVMSALDSSTFQAGLKLASTAQPAIAPLADLAVGVTKMIASRNRNKMVQQFFMGLDFSNVLSRAKLAQGSYVCVQVPDSAQWTWSDWRYDPQTGRVTPSSGAAELVPYNYVIFSVSRMTQG